MTPREDKPPQQEEDEDEWYYSLGRRNAENHDAPFANWGIVIIVGGVVLIPFCLLAASAIGGAGSGVVGLIILFLLLLIFPITAPFLLLAFSVSFSSLLQLFRQIFKPK